MCIALVVQIKQLHIPTLLLWGDADPISPVQVGEQLAALLPVAQLQVLAGADHDLVETHAVQLAPLINTYLFGID